MPKITVSVPSLIQGISQQPDALRFASQAAVQTNAYSSVVDGLTKRQPFDHLALLYGGSAGNPLMHWINRDAGEQYAVLFNHKSIKVYQLLDGVEVPVKGPTGPGYAPDFATYLDMTRPNLIIGPESFSAIDGWSLTGPAVVPSASASPGPLGSGLGVLVGAIAGAGSDPMWEHPLTTFSVTKQTLSCYFKKDTAAAFSLSMFDAVHALEHSATFTWVGTDLTVSGTAGGATGAVERVADGWWRASVTFQPRTAGGGATVGGNALAPRMRILDHGAAAKLVIAWGMRFDRAATAQDYLYRPSDRLRALTVADYTFLLNTEKTVAMSGSLTAADPSKLKGYAFVRASGYNRNYTVKLKKVGGGVLTANCKTWDGATVVPPPTLKSIQTDDIAQELADVINSVALSISGANHSANGIAADGWAATRVGSVVKIARTNATEIDSLEFSDSAGDSDLVKVHAFTRNVTTLPLTCEDGFTIKYVGETTETADDYYLKFVSDKAGSFGNGHWVEAAGPAQVRLFDAATMPWQLTRQQDDGGGTVTGTPNAKYFRWAPATWNERLIGDNESNPVPSVVGQKLHDVFFHRNRLGLLGGQNVVLSEAGVYFNFFRTTVQQLLDSDLIDIAVPHTSVVSLNHAVSAADTLFLQSDYTFFRVTGDPILTPKTVQVSPVLQYESLRNCHPLATDRGVFFAYQRGSFTGVREILPSNQVADAYEPDDISAAIPRYIPGLAHMMASSPHESMLMVLTDNDPGAIFVYKWFLSGGQKLQSAWSRYTLGTRCRILGVHWIESYCYVAVQHEDSVWLHRSLVSAGRVDDGSTFITHLDRRFQAGTDTGTPGIYDSSADTTTWVTPYAPDLDIEMQVVTRSPEAGFTASLSIDRNARTVTAQGDLSGSAVWIGQSYRMEYEFSRPVLKVSEGQGKVAIAGGRYSLLSGALVYANSGYFRIEIDQPARDTSQEEFSGGPLGSMDEVLGQLILTSGTFTFGIYSLAEEATIRIVNDSPLPSNLESAEWEANYETKSTRFRG